MAVDITDYQDMMEGAGGEGERSPTSDWIDQVSAALAGFNEEHRHEVKPCIIRGEMCLLVRKGLAVRNPKLFAHISKFAEENRLRIQKEQRTLDLPTSIERRAH